ncbi:MAG: molybdopterin-dependent oxidoreductase [Gammaproteobacteria bacterium]
MTVFDDFNPRRRAFLGAAATGSALSIAGFPSRALGRINAPHRPELLKETTEVFSFCDMCYWRCGLKIRSRDGRAVKIDGNPEHPHNYGVVCAKGNAGLMAAYDPDRLKYPMLRVGERGAGQWKQISWDEALDRVAESLLKIKDKYGAHALAMVGHGTWEKPYHRLAHAFGTPNTTSPVHGLCCGPREVASTVVTGRGLTGKETLDLENCRYFLMMGRNITESLHNGEVRAWIEAVSRGAKVVYVDPRHTITASKADEWLPIRPLTDHALLLALIHVVVNEELYDRQFVAEYVTGLDALHQRVQQYTPEWAARETDIPADTIRRIARDMARHAPAVLVYAPRRLTRTTNDIGTGVAIATLNALFGAWDHTGGVYNPQVFKIPEPDLPPFEHAHAYRYERGGDFGREEPVVPPEFIGGHGEVLRADGAGVAGRWPLASSVHGLTNEMWKAMAEQEPYPIKALITAGGNGFLNSTDYDTIRQAIANLDFFVAADIAPNEMNMHADILLPEASYLERYDDLQIGGSHEGYVAIRMPAMKPLHDTRDAWSICKGLAERMELGQYFPHESVADLIDERLKKVGLSRAELEQKGVIKIPADPAKNFPREHGAKSVFPTPSGKVELVPSRLTELGLDGALDYEPQVRPEPGEFYLISGRIGFHTHARTQNNPWLADFMRENELWIHPDAAAEHGIGNGDRVKVTDQRGRSETIKAKVTARIRKDTVFMVHGFGHFDPRMSTAHGQGASDSNLASRDQDKSLGSIAMGRSLVRIEKP